MPEYHSPEEERVMRRVGTVIRCQALAMQTLSKSIQEFGAALERMKDACDFNEIRRLDPPTDT